MQPKIAVCLICGNEEAIIGRALDSAFSVSETVVVVRAIGGKTADSSLDVARSRGCLIGEYRNSLATLSWPFVDDFAAARNESFRIAMDAGADWLMWMDCDDILPDGMGETIRQACADTKEEWILAEYDLPEHRKSVLRERLFRRGTAAWINAVHEKCAPISVDPTRESISVRVRKDIRVIHAPKSDKTGSQERNINILLWRYQEAQHIAFYLHYEHFLLGKHDEAIKYGLQALRLDGLDGVYRYEALLNLSMLVADNAKAQETLGKAIKLCPTRREAHHLLSLLQIDAGQTGEAIKTAEHCLSIPEPRIYEWTHRPDVYGWKAYAALAWAHRANGDAAKAESVELAMLERGGRPRISLLHATRGRWSQAVKAMSVWISRAENPEAIEHWFAVDSDDAESLEKLARFRRVECVPGGYSVGAWNTAAAAATGDILVQMSDDFEPPIAWDKMIIDALGDPSLPRVLRVSDGIRSDSLITLAIITRAWHDAHGLFDPAFRNVYSDNDLTARAEKTGAIIDAHEIVFTHHHPIAGKAEWDKTYERGNDLKEYERAKALFHAKHSSK